MRMDDGHVNRRPVRASTRSRERLRACLPPASTPLLLAALAALTPGCTWGPGAPGSHADDRTLTPEAFRTVNASERADAGASRHSPESPDRPPAPPAPQAPARTPGAPAILRPGDLVPVAGPSAAPDRGPADVAAVPGRPEERPNPEARPGGPGVLIDGVVGQINGKPVYIGEFLGQMESRLRQEVERTRGDRRAWDRVASEVIGAALVDRVRNELLLAEARAMLTPEQRRGLLAFMTNIRENIAARFGGSPELAGERLREAAPELYATLDERVKEERDLAMLRMLLDKHVTPRIIVSWRDVQNEYERNIERFQPPPTATVRLIRVPASDEARIAEVDSALREGRAFADIAASELNDFLRSAGGRLDPVRIEGSLADTQLVTFPNVDAAARRLEPGSFAGPIRDGASVYWVLLEEIRQSPGVSLEEAQLELQSTLRQRRERRESERFFREIFERGSKTDIEQMAARLLEIAGDRIFVPELARLIGEGRIPAPPTPSR